MPRRSQSKSAEPRARGATVPRGKVTVWVLGDQLSPRIASLEGLAPGECVVLMIESLERSRQFPYHKQKIALVWSAMRHFAEELRSLGHVVDYHEASPDFAGALRAHARRFRPERVRLLETAEHGATAPLVKAARGAGLEVEVVANNLFISDRAEFSRQAEGRKTLLLESFYRRMRRKTGLLMLDGEPAGGEWNYDRANRERPPKGHVFPDIPRYRPDGTTRAVIETVSRTFPGHFGEIEEFAWPVTRDDAERFLDDFLERRLDLFGPYEDAIVHKLPEPPDTSLHRTAVTPGCQAESGGPANGLSLCVTKTCEHDRILLSPRDPGRSPPGHRSRDARAHVSAYGW